MKILRPSTNRNSELVSQSTSPYGTPDCSLSRIVEDPRHPHGAWLHPATEEIQREEDFLPPQFFPACLVTLPCTSTSCELLTRRHLGFVSFCITIGSLASLAFTARFFALTRIFANVTHHLTHNPSLAMADAEAEKQTHSTRDFAASGAEKAGTYDPASYKTANNVSLERINTYERVSDSPHSR